MQRWEYITLIAKAKGSSYGPFSEVEIYSINGDTLKSITKLGKGFFGVNENILLDTYLKIAGNDGWEVTGLSPINSTGDGHDKLSLIIILKKPLDES